MTHWVRLFSVLLFFLAGCGPGINLAPTVLTFSLSDAPDKYDQSASFTVSGDITSYAYSFQSDGSSCPELSSYTRYTTSQKIELVSLGTIGSKKLCVEGFDASGNLAGVQSVSWQFAVPQLADTGLTRFTTAGPLLQAETPNSDLRHVFCEIMPNYFSNPAGLYVGRQPSVFVYKSKIYLSLITKRLSSFEPGWSQSFAEWDGNSATASWVDGDLGTGTFDTFTQRAHRTISGPRLGHVLMAYYAQGEGDFLLGWFSSYFNWSAFKNYMTISDSLVQFNSKMPRTNQQFTSGSNTWHLNIGPRGVVYRNGVLYRYEERFGTEYSIVAASGSFSTSGIDFSTLRDPTVTTADASDSFSAWNESAEVPTIVSDYRAPYVAKYEYAQGTAYYMVAYQMTRQRWELLSGSSPTEFDTANPVSLDLAARAPSGGSWDNTYFDVTGTGEPLVVGVGIVNDTLNVFYIAGDLDYPGAPPANCARGVGVYRASLVRP
jgi:hypothetical protein